MAQLATYQIIDAIRGNEPDRRKHDADKRRVSLDNAKIERKLDWDRNEDKAADETDAHQFYRIDVVDDIWDVATIPALSNSVRTVDILYICRFCCVEIENEYCYYRTNDDSDKNNSHEASKSIVCRFIYERVHVARLLTYG